MHTSLSEVPPQSHLELREALGPDILKANIHSRVQDPPYGLGL